MERKIKGISVYANVDALIEELREFKVTPIDSEDIVEGTVTQPHNLVKNKRNAERFLLNLENMPDSAFTKLKFRTDGKLKNNSKREVYDSNISMGAIYDRGSYKFQEYKLVLDKLGSGYMMDWEIRETRVTKDSLESKKANI